VPERHATGEPGRDPMNYTSEPPPQPMVDALSVLRAMPEPWRVGRKDAANLAPAIQSAPAARWTIKGLVDHLSRNPDGVQYPARVLARRLADLPERPAASRPNPVSWCGECEDERSRTITITRPDGTDSAMFCPRCSPQAQRRKNAQRRGGELDWRTTCSTSYRSCWRCPARRRCWESAALPRTAL
jgi:hypothetical protein